MNNNIIYIKKMIISNRLKLNIIKSVQSIIYLFFIFYRILKSFYSVAWIIVVLLIAITSSSVILTSYSLTVVIFYFLLLKQK